MLNWHVEYLCNELQRVYEAWERGESQKDVLINIPPGSSKSTICTQIFPAWLWTRNASIRIISASYSADLSTIHAVKSRDILKSEKYQQMYPGHIVFKTDTDGKTHYKNTKNGERFVTSTGGTVTGMHGDFIITDDPIKPMGAAGADSAALTQAEAFVRTTLPSRKTNTERTVTIMIMQRLHDKDPSGMWLKEWPDRVHHICIPALIEIGGHNNVSPAHLSDHYAGNYKVEESLQDMDIVREYALFNPLRLKREAIDGFRQTLGSFGFAGQYLQDPSPKGGGYWKAQWFKIIPDKFFPDWRELDYYGTDWDTAYTAKEENDASAWITAGKMGGNAYIDKAGYVRQEMPQLVKTMSALPGPAFVEAKASGKSAVQVLRHYKFSAVEVQVLGGDKLARTGIATPWAESGFVCIRESIADMILNDPEQGILRFPKAPHDDLNDAFSQSLQRLFGSSYGVGVA